ncbi:MAG: LPXTG cell wall anchor domain-containing protein [Nocardioidaceae bacterium]|nr:LPXTG cell wall anchor domain-containing protein [Nocardioidaceae bacterium]MCL2614389.1 LPXTG cell wall anchor domain-containing protein [Nocardioidaceae bacterium]
MFGKVIAFVAAATATVLLAGPASAGSYGNKVNTACNVRITAQAGKAISAYIDVNANATNKISGTVTIRVYEQVAKTPARVAARPAGRLVWSTSAHYSGKPLSIRGPVLPAGRAEAVGTFSADPGTYLDCRCFRDFRTRGVAAQHLGKQGSGSGMGGLGGTLPNTGGPSAWWVYLGAGLVLAGGSSVYASRRRRLTV